MVCHRQWCDAIEWDIVHDIVWKNEYDHCWWTWVQCNAGVNGVIPCATNTVIPVPSRVEIQCTPLQGLYNCLPVKGMLTMELADVKHVRSELWVGKLIVQLQWPNYDNLPVLWQNCTGYQHISYRRWSDIELTGSCCNRVHQSHWL